MKVLRSILIIGAFALTIGPSPASAGRLCRPDPGPVFLDNPTPCVPTPQECQTGSYNGIYDMGAADGRFAICLAEDDHVLVYAAGDFLNLCGAVFAADRYVIGSYSHNVEDPNTCFRGGSS